MARTKVAPERSVYAPVGRSPWSKDTSTWLSASQGAAEGGFPCGGLAVGAAPDVRWAKHPCQARTGQLSGWAPQDRPRLWPVPVGSVFAAAMNTRSPPVPPVDGEVDQDQDQGGELAVAKGPRTRSGSALGPRASRLLRGGSKSARHRPQLRWACRSDPVRPRAVSPANAGRALSDGSRWRQPAEVGARSGDHTQPETGDAAGGI